MEHIKSLLETLSQHLEKLARGNAVVARPVTIGERSVIPLVELSLGIGGGGGSGEAEPETQASGSKAEKGTGGGAGGSAKAIPVAVVVVDGDNVRLERLC